METETTQKNKIGGRTFKGVVVSDKMKDTVVVSIARFVKHPKIGKYIRLKKKIKAHDAGNTKKIGEEVVIQETRPISKDKHFRVIQEHRD